MLSADSESAQAVAHSGHRQISIDVSIIRQFTASRETANRPNWFAHPKHKNRGYNTSQKLCFLSRLVANLPSHWRVLTYTAQPSIVGATALFDFFIYFSIRLPS